MEAEAVRALGAAGKDPERHAQSSGAYRREVQHHERWGGGRSGRKENQRPEAGEEERLSEPGGRWMR